ncbi:Protein FLX-like 1 [Linum grandiflorum]
MSYYTSLSGSGKEKDVRTKRGPPPPMKGLGLPSSVPDPHYGRGLGSLPPHPALREEIRETQFGLDHRRPPPHPSMIEEHLLAQYQEIQVLLGDNQRLAATHVALKQELEATQHELQRIAQYADSLHPDRDIQMGGLHEKSIKLEADLRGVEATRNELHLVRSDIKELTDAKQELTGRMKMMTQDLARYNTDLKQVPALKTEIETMTRDLQRARSAIEYEKKGYAENFEHGQVMEKKLFSMARELEKLRAEIAIAEKQSRTVPNLGNQAYNPNYNHPEAAYAGNPYPAGYGMTPCSFFNQFDPCEPTLIRGQPSAESFSQYGFVPGTWGGAYDMRAQGR